jgi:hypothetical protein
MTPRDPPPPRRHHNGHDLDAPDLAELRRLARSQPRSGREAIAKASAIRTLERLNRTSRTIPLCPEGWHPGPAELEELDRDWLEQHPEARQQMWEWDWRRGAL